MDLSNVSLAPYYSLSEAKKLFAERPDIDEDYFLLAGIKGDIRIAIKTNPSNVKNDVGGVFFEDFECIDNIIKSIPHSLTFSHIADYLSTKHGLLVVCKYGLYDIKYNGYIPLADTYFTNLYSIIDNRFFFKEEYLSKIYNLKYSDQLNFHALYSMAMYSMKQNLVAIAPEDENGNIFYPIEASKGDDWLPCKVPKFNIALLPTNEIFSERIITKNDLYIFGVDLKLLLEGKNRNTLEDVQTSASKSLCEKKNKLDPRRKKSLFQIISVLTYKNNGIIPKEDYDISELLKCYQDLNLENMDLESEKSLLSIIQFLAQNISLDLSHPHSAYHILEKYSRKCESTIPSPKICADILKKANEY